MGGAPLRWFMSCFGMKNSALSGQRSDGESGGRVVRWSLRAVARRPNQIAGEVGARAIH